MSFKIFKCFFFISASYLVAKFHKDVVMHSRNTGPLLNLGPFDPMVILGSLFVIHNSDTAISPTIQESHACCWYSITVIGK